MHKTRTQGIKGMSATWGTEEEENRLMKPRKAVQEQLLKNKTNSPPGNLWIKAQGYFVEAMAQT